jgi:hypothetical protein
MKVVKLKSSMDRAVGFMTELFQEVRTYKRPGRATVAVVACLALLHSQGRKEVMPHIKHYGGQKCVVPKEGMELQSTSISLNRTSRIQKIYQSTVYKEVYKEVKPHIKH